jgi:hypothetical protein
VKEPLKQDYALGIVTRSECSIKSSASARIDDVEIVRLNSALVHSKANAMSQIPNNFGYSFRIED